MRRIIFTPRSLFAWLLLLVCLVCSVETLYNLIFSNGLFRQSKQFNTLIGSNRTSGCEIKEAIEGNTSYCSVVKDGCVPFFVASFPGSGAALTRNLFEALSGIKTHAVGYNGIGKNRSEYQSPYYKTHQPVKKHRITNKGEFTRAVVLVRHPLDAIPSFYNFQYERKSRLQLHSVQAPLVNWTKHRDSNFYYLLEEWKNHFTAWMDLDLDEKLVISFERLVSNDVGSSVSTKLGVFFNKTSSVMIPDSETIKCVWYKVVKRDSGNGRQSHRKKLYDPPYTKDQLKATISMLRSLIREYKNETIVSDLKNYKDKINKKLKMANETTMGNRR